MFFISMSHSVKIYDTCIGCLWIDMIRNNIWIKLSSFK